MFLLPVLVLAASCQASPAPEPGTFYHQYRAPGLSWSVRASGPGNSLHNIRSYFPFNMRPLSPPHPAWSHSPWGNAQDTLPGHDHGHQHQHNEEREIHFNSLMGDILNPFSVIGSIIGQITSGLHEIHNEVDGATKTVNQDEVKINDEEEETLDDIIREVFGIQDSYPIPNQEQFATMKAMAVNDLEEAINRSSENIADEIKSEGEDIPLSTLSTKGYETLNAIINEYRKLQKHEEIEKEEGENNEEGGKEDKYEPEYNEGNVAVESLMGENGVPIIMADLKMELVDGNIITNEV